MYIIIKNIDIIIYHNVHNYSFGAIRKRFLSKEKDKRLLWKQENDSIIVPQQFHSRFDTYIIIYARKELREC